MVGEVNCAYERGDRALERPGDMYYRRFRQLVGLRDLRDLAHIPPRTWSHVLGSGSSINTAAIVEDLEVVIHATYWDRPGSSDHHKPLLLRVVKPVSQCEAKLAEFRLPPVSLLREQSHAYGASTHAALGSRIDPVTQLEAWLRKLHLAMYRWADDAGLVEERRHNRADLESRLAGETKKDADAAPMENSLEMLPDRVKTLRLLALEASLDAESVHVKHRKNKEGVLGLLIKNRNKAPDVVSNLRGIKISSHLFKVGALAYLEAKDLPGIIIQAVGGPFLMGGLKGVAISDMVRLALMGHEVVKIKQHLGNTLCRPAEWSILVMDKKQFHDLLTHEGLPAVDSSVGLRTREELTSYT